MTSKDLELVVLKKVISIYLSSFLTIFLTSSSTSSSDDFQTIISIMTGKNLYISSFDSADVTLSPAQIVYELV